MIPLKFPRVFHGDLVALSELRLVLRMEPFEWELKMLQMLYMSDEYLLHNQIKIVQRDTGKMELLDGNNPNIATRLKSTFVENSVLIDKVLAERIINARNEGVRSFLKRVTQNMIPNSSWNSVISFESEGTRQYVCAIGINAAGHEVTNPQHNFSTQKRLRLFQT